jgi:hypothetical protein
VSISCEKGGCINAVSLEHAIRVRFLWPPKEYYIETHAQAHNAVLSMQRSKHVQFALSRPAALEVRRSVRSRLRAGVAAHVVVVVGHAVAPNLAPLVHAAPRDRRALAPHVVKVDGVVPPPSPYPPCHEREAAEQDCAADAADDAADDAFCF